MRSTQTANRGGVVPAKLWRTFTAFVAALALAATMMPTAALAADGDEEGESGDDASAVAMTLDEVYEVALDDGEQTGQFTFKPSEGGEYLFHSYKGSKVDGLSAALYKDVADEDDEDDAPGPVGTSSSFNGDFWLDATLEANATYRLECTGDDSGTFLVIVTKKNERSITNCYVEWGSVKGGRAASLDALDVSVRALGGGEREDEGAYPLRPEHDYNITTWFDVQGTALDAAPSEAGDYYMQLSGIGEGSDGYTGAIKLPFSIVDSHDLSGYILEAGNLYADQTVSVSALNIRLVADYDDTVQLKFGTDYTLRWYKEVYDSATGESSWELYENGPSKEAGYYKVEAVPAQSSVYSGSAEETYYIYDPKDIGDYDTYIENNDFWADGSSMSLGRLGTIRFYRHGDASRALKLGSDYAFDRWQQRVWISGGEDDEDSGYWTSRDVSSVDMGKPGVYRAVFKGKGAYTGEVGMLIWLNDIHDLSEYDYDVANDGLFVQSSAGVGLDDLKLRVYRSDENGKQTVLSYGTDYVATGWYIDDDDDDEADDENGDSDENEDEGSEDTPAVIPVGTKLTEPGDYKLRLEGRGAYAGENSDLNVYVTIADEKDLSHASISGLPYGVFKGAVTVNPVVTTVGGKRLQAGVDYTASVWDWSADKQISGSTITAPGWYEVAITAAGNSGYTGRTYREFQLIDESKRTPIADDYFIDGLEASYKATGSAIKPSVTVHEKEDYGEWLEEGYDYTVSYKNNVAVGTATVTVTGINWYKGSISATFKITGAAVGTKVVSGTNSYKVVPSSAGLAVAFTGTKSKSSVSIPATVKDSSGTVYKVTTVAANAFKGSKVKKATLGSNITTLQKNAFKGAKKLKTLEVKTTQLTKSSVKGALSGSKVKTVKVPKSKKKAYKQIFVKKVVGKKVKVK